MSAGALVIVRHADTDWSESGQHTGRTDIPLNARGRAKALALVDRLAGHAFAEVWCSPLARASETCELAGFSQRAQPRAALVEWSYGDYEGITTAQIQERRPGWDLWRDGCPGGETIAQVAARADAVLAALPAQGDVLAFSHGHFLRVLVARWLGLDGRDGARFTLEPGGIGVLGHEHGRRVLSALGADHP